ncbi:MAG: hypothetical protein ABL949_05690 [Fimbriimonadaceae bacterium]
MDVRPAIQRQYHAAMAMMRQTIERCPDQVWTSGEHPRTYWRIAYHAAAYAHLYLYESLDTIEKWDKARVECTYLDGEVDEAEAYSKQDMLDYVDLIVACIDERIDRLDFANPHCGYSWYPEVSQFELMILSLRHLHGHIGQLHETLIAHGQDVDWMGQINMNG